jgi:hypothetical protein
LEVSKIITTLFSSIANYLDLQEVLFLHLSFFIISLFSSLKWDFFIYDLIKEIVYLIHIVFKYHIAYLEPFIILTIIILL